MCILHSRRERPRFSSGSDPARATANFAFSTPRKWSCSLQVRCSYRQRGPARIKKKHIEQMFQCRIDHVSQNIIPLQITSILKWEFAAVLYSAIHNRYAYGTEVARSSLSPHLHSAQSCAKRGRSLRECSIMFISINLISNASLKEDSK